eukprot:GEMP01032507.1.p1 GENE.GEMP01032507.1~~GEMP01032507.1.p1  ORF type:complete len:336 (+),score=43.54 GEMP01032507.1:205-1212(+)
MDQVEEATTSPGAVAKQETKQTEVPQLGGAALPAMFTGIPASILVIKFACLFAGLLGAVTLFAPWYRQLSDRRMGHAFISGRFYGLTYVTDANFSVTQWYTVQESMCRKSGELARSQLSLKNIVTQELAHGSSGSKTSTGSWVKALGIFLHCRYRDTCKNAVYKRCQTYRTLAISLMVGLFFILFGTIILILVFFITGGDKETAVAQKLAAKKRAATKTLIFVAIGMGMHLFGYMMGFGMFDKVMIQLRKDSIYPYPSLFVGAYFAIVSICFASIACACSLHRFQNAGKPRVSPKAKSRATGDAAAASGEEYYGQDWGEDGTYGEWQESWGNWWG